MHVKRKLMTSLAALSLSLGAVVAVSGPASAATPAWIVISSSTSCFHYSFGTLCTTKTTSKRNVSYCTSPPISNPWGSMAWATYCIKYTETSYWP